MNYFVKINGYQVRFEQIPVCRTRLPFESKKAYSGNLWKTVTIILGGILIFAGIIALAIMVLTY